MKKRIKSPEQAFLSGLQSQEGNGYRMVKWLGVLMAFAIIAQAIGLAKICSDLALHNSFSLDAAALAASAFFIKVIIQYAREQISAASSRSIRFNLRQRLIDHLTRLGPNRLHIDEDAALSTRVYEQVDALDDYYTRYVPQVFLVTFVPLTILIAVAPVSWVAFGIFVVTAPLVIFFMILVGHKAAQANRKQFSVLSLLSNQFLDLNQGLAELKRLGQTNAARERLSLTAHEYQKTTMGVLRLAFLSTGTLELFSSVAIAMVALYLGLGLLEQLPWQVGVAPVSLFAAFYLLLLAPEFYLPLRQLGNDYHAKQKAEAAATDIAEVLGHTQTDRTSQTTIACADTTKQCLIKFDSLSWRQGGRDRLKPMTATIQSGERVWLSGQSGSGKSSLMTVLLGFEHDYVGSVLISGCELRSTNIEQWRKRLAWLPQKPEWVQGTIRQNLELGIGRRSENDLRFALERAQCWAVVNKLPLGLDTPISEAGTGLSGGQMQRLSIARALLSEADIWLLDEPCSSLDNETADQILDILDQVSVGKTLIIVSHDTHPVRWADQHWFMSKEGLHVEAQTVTTDV
ncbi:thiol reductant ABC exporter subunit CydD [Marinomonas piezotolerans]|nr:thiol reductant ABC exporter subunit CydD [Marinomonas piezotolerans]